MDASRVHVISTPPEALYGSGDALPALLALPNESSGVACSFSMTRGSGLFCDVSSAEHPENNTVQADNGTAIKTRPPKDQVPQALLFKF